MAADGVLKGITADLAADAAKMAAGEAVPREIEQRAIGRIGLMVCEFAGMFWSEDELRDIVHSVFSERIASHAESCAQIRKGEPCVVARENGASPSVPTSVAGRVWAVLDKHFNHLWWGFVVLCLALGVNRVVDAVLTILRAFGMAGGAPG